MQITNWDKWQTYRKDRGTPPWIKVYRNLLSNSEWVSLTDQEKGQLVSIWILAADKNGEVPDNPKMLAKMAMLDEAPNVSKFKDLGFMTSTCQPSGNHVVTTLASTGCQHDAPETETETETETDERQNKEKKEKKKISLNDLSVDHIRDWLDKKRSEGKYLNHDEHFILEQFKDYCEANGRTYKNYVAALHRAFTWDTCQPKPNGANYGNKLTDIDKAVEEGTAILYSTYGIK